MIEARRGIVSAYAGGETVSVVVAPSTVAVTVAKFAHYAAPAIGDRVIVHVDGALMYIVGKVG